MLTSNLNTYWKLLCSEAQLLKPSTEFQPKKARFRVGGQSRHNTYGPLVNDLAVKGGVGRGEQRREKVSDRRLSLLSQTPNVSIACGSNP